MNTPENPAKIKFKSTTATQLERDGVKGALILSEDQEGRFIPTKRIQTVVYYKAGNMLALIEKVNKNTICYEKHSSQVVWIMHERLAKNSRDNFKTLNLSNLQSLMVEGWENWKIWDISEEKKYNFLNYVNRQSRMLPDLTDPSFRSSNFLHLNQPEELPNNN